jgi:hypothetical protein
VLIPGSKNVGRDYHLVQREDCDVEAEKGQDVRIRAKGWTGDCGGKKAKRWIGRTPGHHSGAEFPVQGTAHFPRAVGDSNGSSVRMGSAHYELPGPNRPRVRGEERGRGFRIKGFGIGGFRIGKEERKGERKGQGEHAENGSENGDGDRNEDEDVDEDGDGDSDGNGEEDEDANRDEMIGKSL